MQLKRGRLPSKRWLGTADRDHPGNHGLLEVISGQLPRRYDRLEVTSVVNRKGTPPQIDATINVRAGTLTATICFGDFKPGQVLLVQDITDERGA